jgi:hypothetical protein
MEQRPAVLATVPPTPGTITIIGLSGRGISLCWVEQISLAGDGLVLTMFALTGWGVGGAFSGLGMAPGIPVVFGWLLVSPLWLPGPACRRRGSLDDAVLLVRGAQVVGASCMRMGESAAPPGAAGEVDGGGYAVEGLMGDCIAGGHQWRRHRRPRRHCREGSPAAGRRRFRADIIGFLIPSSRANVRKDWTNLAGHHSG